MFHTTSLGISVEAMELIESYPGWQGDPHPQDGMTAPAKNLCFFLINKQHQNSGLATTFKILINCERHGKFKT